MLAVIEEKIENTPRAYISGNCVVAYDDENNAWVAIYAPRNRRGDQTPYNATGDKPAPSFSHMMVF